MTMHASPWSALAVALVLTAGLLPAEDKKPAVPPVPDYPRGLRSPVFEVDQSWPQRPESIERQAVTGIAVDGKNQIWIASRTNPPVQCYSQDGKFLRGFGKDVIDSPHHMKIDAKGHVWVADTVLHTLFKFTPEGKLLLTLGIPGEYGEDERRLSQPTDVVLNPQGEIFVSDGYGNNRVVHYDADGKFVKQWGQLGSEPGEFCNPHAIAIDSSGRLYVADRYNGRVQVFSQDGEVLDVWNNLVIPWGLWISPNDDVWVCGSSLDQWPDDSKSPLGSKPKDQLILKFDTAGKLRQLWSIPLGGEETEPGQLNLVHCLAFDKAGNLYCGDILGKRAQKFVLKK
jgi:DNA-binding beta-propeller fold protein YncE